MQESNKFCKIQAMKKPKPISEDQLGLFGQPPEPEAPKPISKSEFIAGAQCDKYFWFERFERNTKKLDSMTLFQLEQGTAVGVLARGLFPQAKYEVSAEAKGVIAKADILNGADLYEVKSSGYSPDEPYKETKEEYLQDLALQVYAFEASGKKIEKAHIVLINKDFVKKGPIDPHAFFNIEDVTAQVREILPQVPELLSHLKRVLTLPSPPPTSIGMHCVKPHDCPFQHRCYPEQVPGHIFKLRMLYKKDKFRLFHEGVKSITEYKGRMDTWQTRQVEVFKSQQTFIDKPAIKAFIANLKYPVYHLDFETFNPAIPVFDGMRPNRHSVFQYSLHIQDSPGAAPRHLEYLPEHLNDPRPEFLRRLLPELEENGTILAYHAEFEMLRLKELAVAYPDYAPQIELLLKRFMDLEKPFSSAHYLHPKMEGKSSIKQVLPALVPSMTYEGMPIAEGMDAVRAYMEILDPKTSENRRNEIRQNLRDYCGQDTLAMVEVLRVLEKV